jgi:hypothetical protein
MLGGALLGEGPDLLALPGVPQRFRPDRHPAVRDDHERVAGEPDHDQRHAGEPEVREREEQEQRVGDREDAAPHEEIGALRPLGEREELHAEAGDDEAPPANR